MSISAEFEQPVRRPRLANGVVARQHHVTARADRRTEGQCRPSPPALWMQTGDAKF